ncbi:hypothetical protein OIU74_013366 [Salix koriyanagi]|uniref:Uncharacterized protein n=1 Tax=Salix koriyanagi TaxID=2511006 RepID=A0A9Q0Q9B0_9ROSI|nr:hypothetical protein OIU74_013366 [Salix koriyanagi]
MFAGELEITGDKNKHTTSRTRRLAINGGDVMLALLERESNKFRNDILGSLRLLTFKSKHRTVLIQIR